MLTEHKLEQSHTKQQFYNYSLVTPEEAGAAFIPFPLIEYL